VKSTLACDYSFILIIILWLIKPKNDLILFLGGGMIKNVAADAEA
jgi:hypothetical protein